MQRLLQALLSSKKTNTGPTCGRLPIACLTFKCIRCLARDTYFEDLFGTAIDPSRNAPFAFQHPGENSFVRERGPGLTKSQRDPSSRCFYDLILHGPHISNRTFSHDVFPTLNVPDRTSMHSGKRSRTYGHFRLYSPHT